MVQIGPVNGPPLQLQPAGQMPAVVEARVLEMRIYNLVLVFRA